MLSALVALAPFLTQAPPDERAAARAIPLPAIGDEDLARWGEVVRPADDERTFERVPWIPTFAGGLRAAERAQRPLLFWAMNGHPLGCT